MRVSKCVCNDADRHLHPGLKIVAFLFLALLVSVFSFYQLIAVAFIGAVLVLYFQANVFFILIKRLRWLFLFVFIIYSFTTPGEYINHWPFQTQPTFEGVSSSVAHILRLCITVQGLSLLLATTSRDQFISGMYGLLQPLKIIGVTRERFAVRLWLTLDYVEKKEGNINFKQLYNDFNYLQLECGMGMQPWVVIRSYPLTWVDSWFLAILMGVLIVVNLIP